MADLKDLAQVKAEELAEERYERGFYDLPDQQQADLYGEADRLEAERLVATAEFFWEHRI